jgi:hypothetical protein
MHRFCSNRAGLRACALLAAALSLGAQSRPIIGKSARYAHVLKIRPT